MREIKNIVIHCTATHQSVKIDDIINFWRTKRKWKYMGYHYIIEANGAINNIQKEETPANGVKGHNRYSIHIAYIGGINSAGKAIDNRTQKQKESLLYLITKIKKKYKSAKILGHRDFINVYKECPSFNAVEEYKSFNKP